MFVFFLLWEGVCSIYLPSFIFYLTFSYMFNLYSSAASQGDRKWRTRKSTSWAADSWSWTKKSCRWGIYYYYNFFSVESILPVFYSKTSMQKIRLEQFWSFVHASQNLSSGLGLTSGPYFYVWHCEGGLWASSSPFHYHVHKTKREQESQHFNSNIPLCMLDELRVSW